MPNVVSTLLLIAAGTLGTDGPLSVGGTLGTVGSLSGDGTLGAAAGASRSAGTDPPASLTCEPRLDGDPGMREFVPMVDRRPLEMELSEWDESKYNLRWVEVVCWSWVEEQYGVRVRNGAIYVMTHDGLEQTRKSQTASLEAIAAAQDRHLQTHGTYVRTLKQLTGVGTASDYDLPKYFRLSLEGTTVGWAATVGPTESWLAGFGGSVLTPPCYAFVGPPPDGWASIAAGDRRTLTEREPLCIEPYREHAVGSEGG